MPKNNCETLHISKIGKKITLYGWVHSKRNFKKLIFIDMRDHTGLVQIVFNKKKSEHLFKKALKIRNEFCIQISGTVSKRIQENKEIKTGNVEIIAESLKILNTSEPLPIDNTKNNFEETKLKYRYLDLRKPEIAIRLKQRAKIVSSIRKFLEKEKFIEIETPILTRETPEGARDYIVPSRIQKGKFYALPQSPQMFKQLLMISGFNRYYQIAKCFRDEDLRSDRQPEFTQIDIEASFLKKIKIQKIIERLIKKIWIEYKGIELNSFPKITFSQAIKRYGTDKPDLRNPLELIDIQDVINFKKFKICTKILNFQKNKLVILKVPKNKKLTTTKLIQYKKIITSYEIDNLSWIKINSIDLKLIEIQNSLSKILTKKIIYSFLKKISFKIGDVLLCCFGKKNHVNNAMSFLRIKIGNDLSITQHNLWKPLWITDFPMFKKINKNQITSMHHPFVAPKYNSINQLKTKPLNVISSAYDMVINGYEIGGGSNRIYHNTMQKSIFKILGITEKEQNDKFGCLLESLKYGAPPHSGLALGLDRIIMLLTNTDNIRDVIAFPKTTNASCLMTNAPNFPDIKLLKELNIK